ncbi:Zn-binding Pro-Ala-Ala-Arg (PAAR) domain-containing protein, incolved in TypeVI secretion [Pseudomonas sp. NFACC19-2]|nr:PAAR domain-containing protein [Pseudomonas sp. NFACC19-2]SFW49443.1 Zn-binding Pro-Ala-Ala-Arg (PAAR) domain-containing protein, incolved in TypeVI secretion [Pseudomonas sp. NFACC19-2]
MSGKPAARLSDPTACPIPGHGTNPIAAGSPDVLFDSLPAARMGDASACGGAMAGAVIPTVLINGKPAAVVGSVGSHGNVVIGGSGTVIIGNTHTPPEFAPLLPMPGYFDEFFVLQDEEGNPVSNYRYRIETDSGELYEGITDNAGRTKIISTGKQPGALSLSLLQPDGVSHA